MKAVNPYLNFLGNTEEAFNFYKSIFGGEFAMIQRFKDTPEAKVDPKDGEKIMHIALPLGNGNVLMGTDELESQGGQNFKVGNNFHLSISADSEAEADKIFKGLSEGGKVTVPMAKMFWGSYFGMVTDKYGTQWMVSHDNR